MAAPYIAHLVSRISSDLAFLQAQNLISQRDVDQIVAKLPSSDVRALDSAVSGLTLGAPAAVPEPQPQARAQPALAPTQRSVPLRPGSGVPPPPAAPAGPPKVMARANWAYNSGDPQDLVFAEGETIEVVEEINGDWWKGRVGGRQGMLPANYVTKIAATPTPMRSPMPPAYSPAQHAVHAPVSSEPKQGYFPPSGPPPWQQQQQQQAQQPQQPQQQPGQAEQKPSRFGALGNTMANSAAGGVGFGAGAAIGSGLINAIF